MHLLKAVGVLTVIIIVWLHMWNSYDDKQQKATQTDLVAAPSQSCRLRRGQVSLTMGLHRIFERVVLTCAFSM